MAIVILAWAVFVSNLLGSHLVYSYNEEGAVLRLGCGVMGDMYHTNIGFLVLY